jgi:hypothetical protein
VWGVGAAIVVQHKLVPACCLVTLHDAELACRKVSHP